MPAKNSGMRFHLRYGYGFSKQAKFNDEKDARKFAAEMSKDGDDASIYTTRHLATYRMGNLEEEK